MIPDLGTYAVPVLSAYGGSILLIAGLVGLSVWRGAKVRRQLRAVEGRARPGAARPAAQASKEVAHG